VTKRSALGTHWLSALLTKSPAGHGRNDTERVREVTKRLVPSTHWLSALPTWNDPWLLLLLSR
jgi:hypothetical protein